MAVHGAGLQNIMVCRQGTVIVELDFGPGLYASISRNKRLPYKSIKLPELNRDTANYKLRDVDAITTNVSIMLIDSGVRSALN